MGGARVAHAAPSPKKPAGGKPGAGKRFMSGLSLAFIVAVLLLVAAHSVLGRSKSAAPGDPAALAESARTALEAVKKRDLATTMTPAKYDSILMPIDQMLREAKAKLESPEYDAVADYDFIRARTEPIPSIADAAHVQATSETTFLKKDYRFMQQKGDACRYLASAAWNRLEALHDRQKPGEPFEPSVNDSNQLLSIIGNGLAAAPESRELWHLKALVERSGGAFASAEESLGKALAIDPNFVAGWNDMGLTCIKLKEFDKAEEAFLRAADLSKKAYDAAKAAPGEDYIAALMNLADFHDALAAYYTREYRADGSEETAAKLRRHQEEARKFAAEIRQYAPYELPSEKPFEEFE